jgi:hypothetical protein
MWRMVHVGGPGGPPTVALKVKHAQFATLYPRPAGDGLQVVLKHVEAW